MNYKIYNNGVLFFSTLFFIIGLSSCKFFDKKENRVVAIVGENKLYHSELLSVLPASYSQQDSMQIVQDYIDKWIRTQLMVDLAEKYLTEEKKDVKKQIEDYKNSLLIYKYEEEFVKQRLDTVVNEFEVKEFYEQNVSNFVLNQPIVKGLFMVFPAKANGLEKVRELIKSDNPDHIKELEAYCYSNASKYEYFENKWVYFEKVSKELPLPLPDVENFLTNIRSKEMTDSSFVYFIEIKDVKLRGDEAPISFVRKNVESIILNKRKIELLTRLEESVYKEAAEKGVFKFEE